MVNNPDSYVKNKLNKQSGNANRGSQGTKIHSDKKKKTEKKIVANLATMYAQSNYNFKMTGSFNDTMTVCGTALLGDVNTYTSTSSSVPTSPIRDLKIVDRLPVSPDTIPSGRLQNISHNFYNYIFKKIRIHYRTRQPQTKDGAIGIYFYDDPAELEDVVPSGYFLETMILEGQRGKISPVYSNFSVDYKGKPFRSMYRVSGQCGSIEDLIQTNVMVAVCPPSDIANAVTMGYLEIEYEIEFSRPKTLIVAMSPQTQPNYNMWFGPGDPGVRQVQWTATSGSGITDFYTKGGIYIATFCQDISGSSADNWAVKPVIGSSYFIKVVPILAGASAQVTFKLYQDWADVVADTPLSCAFPEWSSFTCKLNMHYIVPDRDLGHRVGGFTQQQVESRISAVVEPKSNTQTVNQAFNQRVYVDPQYIQDDLRTGQRNLTTYL